MIGDLAQTKANKEQIEALIQPVDTADRILQELQTFVSQIEDLESKLGFRVQGAKTMEDIQLQLNTLQNDRYNTLFFTFLIRNTFHSYM